jgi:hypothetical protein
MALPSIDRRNLLRLLGGGLAFGMGLGGAALASRTLRLYVFVSSTDKPHALEERLQEALRGVEVTVFGRYRDFELALTEAPPDAVVSLRVVLDELGLPASLQGVTGARTDEPYVLLSVDHAVRPDDVQSVGSVDLLGRSRMKTFVADVLGRGTAPKVKLVTKTEDLLPLLQFGVTEAVLLPQRHTASVLSRSELNLVSVLLPTKVGLVAASAVSTDGHTVMTIIKSLDMETSKALGAEAWQ